MKKGYRFDTVFRADGQRWDSKEKARRDYIIALVGCIATFFGIVWCAATLWDDWAVVLKYEAITMVLPVLFLFFLFLLKDARDHLGDWKGPYFLDNVEEGVAIVHAKKILSPQDDGASVSDKEAIAAIRSGKVDVSKEVAIIRRAYSRH